MERNKNLDRGGFQDRDVGRSNFDRDFGPDYGPDYARYADPPDFEKDAHLKDSIINLVFNDFSQSLQLLDLNVRNGFVFAKVNAQTSQPAKEHFSERVKQLPGVKDIVTMIEKTKH